MSADSLDLKPIGVIHSCFSEKFGIPRQAGLVKNATAELELYKEFGREEMFRGLDQFSHIWVSFIFHKVIEDGWRPTTRPPWLGGQKRVGVFASRTPHRPNFLGLSVVKLEGIRTRGSRVVLDLSGVDLLDQTPVVDIRPYLPYSDIRTEAEQGYAGIERKERPVVFTAQAQGFCHEYQKKTGKDLQKLLEEVIGQDPRPAFQRDRDREFGVLLWNVNSRFVFRDSGTAEVLRCDLAED